MVMLPQTGRRQPQALPADLVVTRTLTTPRRADPRQPIVRPRCTCIRSNVIRHVYSDSWSLLLAIRLHRFAVAEVHRARDGIAIDAGMEMAGFGC